MPWDLTTPVPTGDLASSDYGEVKLVRMTHDSEQAQFRLRLSYGNTNAGNWEAGYTPVGKDTGVLIEGADYDAIATTEKPSVTFDDKSADPNYSAVVINHSTHGDLTVYVEKTYSAVKRGLYEWLNDNGYIDAGTVV